MKVEFEECCRRRGSEDDREKENGEDIENDRIDLPLLDFDFVVVAVASFKDGDGEDEGAWTL